MMAVCAYSFGHDPLKNKLLADAIMSGIVCVCFLSSLAIHHINRRPTLVSC